MPVYLLKARQGYTVTKTEKGKWTCYISINAGMKFRYKEKFRYGILIYSGSFRALSISIIFLRYRIESIYRCQMKTLDTIQNNSDIFTAVRTSNLSYFYPLIFSRVVSNFVTQGMHICFKITKSETFI
jgi:hypothetical protein